MTCLDVHLGELARHLLRQLPISVASHHARILYVGGLPLLVLELSLSFDATHVLQNSGTYLLDQSVQFWSHARL